MKVGITGHQNIDVDIIEWLKDRILTEIKKIKIEKGYTSLAVGADQLFANILIENEIPIVAVIPSENYVLTFEKEFLNAYLALRDKAESVMELRFHEPTEIAFFRAGKIIAENVDVLFAVWDGKPAKGLGGTADIVEYMNSLNKRIIHFNVTDKTVVILEQQ